MKKAEFVTRIAHRLGCNKLAAEKTVAAVMETILYACDNGGITLRPYGGFMKKNRKERMGRNPKTGEKIAIPAKERIVFRQSKTQAEK
jgi:DNA-binding protein HU-beta